jgi:hypothetical protein
VSNTPPVFGPIYDDDSDPSADLDLQNLIRDFVSQCCVLDVRRAEVPRALFEEFKRWMKFRGRTKCGGKKSFIREFLRVVPGITVTSFGGGRVFTGIGLRRGRG